MSTTEAEGQMIGGLAERWDVSDDGLVWTFHLRPNLSWSDGKPLTADDVVWSFRRLMDPKTGARYAANLYVLKGGRAVNQGAPMAQLGVSAPDPRSEEHTSELQSLMRISYAVFCLKKKNHDTQ